MILPLLEDDAERSEESLFDGKKKERLLISQTSWLTFAS
jgi:hypothetical protein